VFFCFCFSLHADSEIVQSTFNITISGKVGFHSSEITVRIPLPVEDETQKILSIYSTHPYKISGNEIILHPEEKYVINLIVARNFSGIKSISNPSENQQDDLSVFLKNDGLTAWNDEIKKKAEEIATGDNDLIKVMEIVKYVHDTIKYDISVDQMPPSTWVFENKRGKCSEFTNLFISMCRSIGIKARAVSGFACSELCEKHAWAEVFIGGRWIDVDPTFMQVPADAAHVVFSRSFESQKIVAGVITSTERVDHTNTISTNMISNKTEDFFDFDIMNKKITEENSTLTVNVLMKNKKDFFVVGFCELFVKNNKNEEKIFYLTPNSNSTVNFNITTPYVNKSYVYRNIFSVRCAHTTKTSEFEVHEKNTRTNQSKCIEILDFDLKNKIIFLRNAKQSDQNATLELCITTNTERKCKTVEVNLKADEIYGFNYTNIFPEENFNLEVTTNCNNPEQNSKLFTLKTLTTDNLAESDYLWIAAVILLTSIIIILASLLMNKKHH